MFTEHLQRFAVGEMVELIEVDLAPVGAAETLRLVPTPFSREIEGEVFNTPVTWRGDVYTPRPFETEGWEWNGEGPPPTPKIRVANVDREMSGLAIAYDDLVGATVTRWKTFKRFLDGEPDADPDAHFEPEIYTIDRKSRHDNLLIEFELATAMEQANVLLPGRSVNKNHCPWRYPHWNATTGQWDYSKAICPYAHQNGFFTADDEATDDPAEDRCSKTLSGCKLRFGTAPLPHGFFPGVQRIRI